MNETHWETAKEQGAITFGRAIVPWGFSSGFMRAGWVLPGGARTLDRERAMKVCRAMDELMG